MNLAIRRYPGARNTSGPRAQRGVVLFIALIVMVALTLAGIALIRSTDTAGIVTGNLAFKQASIAAVERSIEQAVHSLWDGTLDRTVDHVDQNYYACVRNAAGSGCIAGGAPVPERPDAVTTLTKFNAAGLSTTLVPADTAGNNVYYVVERMCLLSGPSNSNNCNISSGALGADPGTQHYFGLIRPGEAYYRLTVRVEGPRNTVTYAQAILQ